MSKSNSNMAGDANISLQSLPSRPPSFMSWGSTLFEVHSEPTTLASSYAPTIDIRSSYEEDTIEKHGLMKIMIRFVFAMIAGAMYGGSLGFFQIKGGSEMMIILLFTTVRISCKRPTTAIS